MDTLNDVMNDLLIEQENRISEVKVLEGTANDIKN